MNDYLEARVSKQNYCWIWTGHVGRDGYGHAHHKGRGMVAHRMVYKELVGEIPVKMTLDHLCRNKKCVNPGHMDVVTQRENNLRSDNQAGLNAKKTHCVHGHEYTPKNTYTYTASRGSGVWRACKTCRGMTIK